MRLSYPAALEGFCFVLTGEVLLILAGDINGRKVTPADGMAATVLCVATVVQCFRVALLTRLANSTTIRESDDTMLLFSGVYLVTIWAMLHIGIVIMAPSRTVFILVGVLFSEPFETVLIGTG